MPAAPRSRLLGAAAVAVGLVVAVVGVTRLSTPSAADFTAPTASAESTVVTVPTDPPPTDVASPREAVTAPDGRAGDPSAAAPPPVPSAAAVPPPPAPTPEPAEPVQVRFERLGVAAGIEGVTSVDGVLQVPEDPQRVGWWVAGALAGADVGTTVLDGHIDSATAGVGFFAHLRDLQQGDLVIVTTAAGDELRYAVESRQTYPKSAPLPAALFERQGPPALVMVTCGGPFDTARRSYEDNIAVTARPV